MRRRSLWFLPPLLTDGTSPERIAAESLTPRLSDFVHATYGASTCALPQDIGFCLADDQRLCAERVNRRVSMFCQAGQGAGKKKPGGRRRSRCGRKARFLPL